MGNKIYPIGIQSFEEDSAKTVIFILIRQRWFINWQTGCYYF